jgi:excisionase family DNA binding protein
VRPRGPEWLTRDEAAAVARVSVATIDRAIRDGRLKATRLDGGRSVRIHRSALATFLGLTVFVIVCVFKPALCDWTRHVAKRVLLLTLTVIAALLVAEAIELAGGHDPLGVIFGGHASVHHDIDAHHGMGRHGEHVWRRPMF